ncbi:MAG TPA: tyrosine-type recombinase/integrase [Armatimonadota bacterium]
MDIALLAPQASDAWAAMTRLVLDGVFSPHTKRAYSKALHDFFLWYQHSGQMGFRRSTVQAFRAELEALALAPTTINQRLCAIRKLAREAAGNGLLDDPLAESICSVRGVPHSGTRTGRWLDRDQASQLLSFPDATTLKGKRDQALLAVMVGCGLRRSEVSALTWQHIHMVERRWVILDLIGKRNRIRTVPIPSWAKVALDAWCEAAEISDGFLFRSMDKADRLRGTSLSSQAIWSIVTGYGVDLHLEFAPHDLRRTHAKLAHRGGAAVEQIQLCLGHSSLLTTQLYLGLQLDLHNAPCDRLGLG